MLAIKVDQTGNDDAALERVHKVCKAFTESPETKGTFEEIKDYKGYGAEDGVKISRRRASFFAQVRLLLQRCLIDNKRNSALAAKFIQKFAMGLFVGLLFVQTLSNEEFGEEYGIKSVNGALFYLVAEVSVYLFF